VVKRCEQCDIDGVKSKGRPHKTWKKVVYKDLRTFHVNMNGS